MFISTLLTHLVERDLNFLFIEWELAKNQSSERNLCIDFFVICAQQLSRTGEAPRLPLQRSYY